MPKLARVASIIAFSIAVSVFFRALTDVVVIAPFALIPLLAGLGICRRRVWSAYGYSLYCFGQFLALLFLFWRVNTNTAEQKFAAVLIFAMVALFFFAGRSLAAASSPRGRAFPWIAVSMLSIVPFPFIHAFVITTGSMENTLLLGDHFLVRSFPKPVPARGDIIVFRFPMDRRDTTLKRIIGVPGDRIRISRKIVYRNGVALAEPFAIHKSDYADSYRDNFPSEPTTSLIEAGLDMLKNHVVDGAVVVPDGKYFVMGDNRDNSLDSRYWGFVSTGDLIGKPILIYSSRDEAHRIRWDRFFRSPWLNGPF